MKNKLWFIDENEDESITYARQLKRSLGDELEVERVFPPYSNPKDYIALLMDPNTACIIIDRKLKNTGVALYTGLDLARFLRDRNNKLPLYILTNFPELDDADASGRWSVEDVIPKEIFKDENEVEIFKARLLRRINVYEDVRDAQAKRFDELLRKQVANSITDQELTELLNLQVARTAVIEASETEKIIELKNDINSRKKFLELLEKLIAQHNE